MNDRSKKGGGQGIIGNSIKNVVEIPIESISPNPYQPRIDFDEDELQELAKSIDENGLLEPILLNRIGDERYQIIAGERRWRAHKLLEKKMIQAIVYGHNLTQEKMYILSLTENIDRQNLHPIEVAIALKNGLTTKQFANQKEITEFLEMSKSTISKYISLCNLGENVIKGAIEKGYKVLNVLSELSKIKDTERQSEIFEEILSNGLSREAAIERIKSLEKTKVSPGKLKAEEPYKGVWGLIRRTKNKEVVTIKPSKLNDAQKAAYNTFLETLRT